MSFRLRLGVLLTVLLMPAVGMAADILVGDVFIHVPAPAGFSPVTRQMRELYELQKQFVAPSNEEFVAFIPEDDVATASAGGIPDLTRRFTVQAERSMTRARISASDFNQLKRSLISEHDTLVKQFEKEFPGLIQNINDGVMRRHDIDAAVSAVRMIPFPVHEQTESTIALSSLVTYMMTDGDGNALTHVTVITTTFAHVNERVLFLYAYAEEDGLEWSRDASTRWANALVLANASDQQSSASGSGSSAGGGFGWSRVGRTAIFGAGGGLLVALAVQALKRRKSS